MVKLMYDSVNANNIPTTASVVAGYINGRYKWNQADWRRFPNSALVRIQVYIPGGSWTSDGDVLDVEAHDAPTQAARDVARAWVGARMAQNKPACIYTSRSTVKFLQFEHCAYWLADYTGAPHLLPGTVATQYVDKGAYDLSVCADDWPYVNPPAPLPPYEGDTYVITPVRIPGTDANGNGYYDAPNTDASKVVNVVANPQDPQTHGYPLLPVFVGALQVGGAARLVFERGQANLGGFDARMITER